ncbi:hypothetical protein BgiBS90_019156, partial [Biomphalaria glabrata]
LHFIPLKSCINASSIQLTDASRPFSCSREGYTFKTYLRVAATKSLSEKSLRLIVDWNKTHETKDCSEIFKLPKTY